MSESTLPFPESEDEQGKETNRVLPLPDMKRKPAEIDFTGIEETLPGTEKRDSPEEMQILTEDFDYSTPTNYSGGLDSQGISEDFSLGAVEPDLEPMIQEVTDDDDDQLNLNVLLSVMIERGASDLHLSSQAFPSIRVDGDMTPLEGYGRLSGPQIHEALKAVVSEDLWKKFEDKLELDFAYTLPGQSRFRVNIMKQQEQTGAVLRAIPWEILTAEQLELPEIVNSFADLPRGLVLVTGPTGSGKSTTLAAIIDRANRNLAGHILTIEDPVEFVHEHRRSIVNQREVSVDTHSFADALKHSLRQDPDIILVGEMRDIETIGIALTAAETGHLVFGTLHTQSVQETITRVIDVFPEGDKSHVRTQLSSTLEAVVCQTLLKRIGGGRIAAMEIMLATDGIRNQIRQDKLQQIQSSLETGQKDGMRSLDGELKRLVTEGLVNWEEAASKATNYKEFIDSLGGQEGIKQIENRLVARQSMGKW